jgi:hypothetical protein
LRNYPVIANAVLVSGELTFGGFARPGSAIELYIAQADPTGFGEGLTYLGTFIEGSAAISMPPPAPTGPATSTASRRARTIPTVSASGSPRRVACHSALP